MQCGTRHTSGFLCILKAGHRGEHLSIDNTKVWQGSPGAPVRWPNAIPDAPVEASPPALRLDTSRALGYSGFECQTCRSLRTTFNGACLKCEDCGSTTGCS